MENQKGRLIRGVSHPPRRGAPRSLGVDFSMWEEECVKTGPLQSEAHPHEDVLCSAGALFCVGGLLGTSVLLCMRPRCLLQRSHRPLGRCSNRLLQEKFPVSLVVQKFWLSLCLFPKTSWETIFGKGSQKSCQKSHVPQGMGLRL